MKKKSKLGLISSIFGVFALCGLSALAIFSKSKRTQSVSASMNQSTLQNVTCRIDSNLTISSFNTIMGNNYSSYTDTFTNLTASALLGYQYRSISGTTIYYDVSTYFGESASVNPYAPYDIRFKLAVDLFHGLEYGYNGNWTNIGNAYAISLITTSNSQYNYGRPAYFQTFYFGYNRGVCVLVDSTFPNTIAYTSSDINFISGDDITNSTLVNVFNGISNFVGYNTFSDEVITAAQYEEIISSLEAQISVLNSENNDLILQSQTAYDDGYNAGVNSQTQWVEQNSTSIYNQGYTDGYNNGSSQDETVATIFSGILQVAFVPVNFFLSIFNFEILGVNLSAFIRAIFTVAITIIVIKMITGKGGDS